MKKIKSEAGEQDKVIAMIANCFTAAGNLMGLLDQATYDELCGQADDLISQKEIWRWGERMKRLSLEKVRG